MKAIMVMFDSLNRKMLPCYGGTGVHTPNFERLAKKCITFENCYAGSLPCMPARRELHTGRYNFLHRSWGPLEPYDDSMPELLKNAGIYTHLVSDHVHYWEDGGATYHTRYSSWEISRGQEGDPWKGQVDDPDESGFMEVVPMSLRKVTTKAGYNDKRRQDFINRTWMPLEEDMPQAVTFANGLSFIDKNHHADNWFLQIETFDPHEPFFSSPRFKELYPDLDKNMLEFDWPEYGKVEQTSEVKTHCINRYKSLLSMCDYYLGTVLDAMDRYNLWKDTLLIVNTDHGFLLGEHDWWGKWIMPYYDEIAHTPLFIWHPEVNLSGVRRQSLVQTIDLAPTILQSFGQKIPKDMMGHDLRSVMNYDTPVRAYALFGSHGDHVNVTDGRYVYMKSPKPEAGFFEYTLMPTHFFQRFSINELRTATFVEPFSFTKGCKLLRTEAQKNPFANVARFGNRLYDMKSDPNQQTMLDEPETEIRMSNAIRELMLDSDAPKEAYENFGLSYERAFTYEDLLAERNELLNRRIAGLEEFQTDEKTYFMVTALLSMIPGEAGVRFKTGIKQSLHDQGATLLTGEIVNSFLQHLPIPNEQKETIFGILKKLEATD